MESKYLEYLDEILEHFWNGNGYQAIAKHLIDKYNLNVKKETLRHRIKDIIQYEIADKEVIEENLKLAKRSQKQADLNRIKNKSFREHVRLENSLVEYNKALIDILKTESLKTTIKQHESKGKQAIIVQIADTHFNELVDLKHNKYDFEVASKRLQKFAHHIKEYASFYNVNEIFIAITGDLLNSDRRLDEKLSMASNRAKATFLGVHLLKHFILDLNSIANISVGCVSGNESRAYELGWVDMVATDNYDFTIFEILRMLLPDINFITSGGLELVVEVNGHNVLLIHGHQLGNMQNDKIAKIISKYARNGIILDFMMCGHLHETKITDMFARSSSLVGANAYSENALLLSSRAAQNIYIMKDNERHDIRIDLQHTKGFKGYAINKELSAYNAKSLDKTHKKQTVFKIVI
jgi:predicted MPP superfamily phosphohydrolase